MGTVLTQDMKVMMRFGQISLFRPVHTWAWVSVLPSPSSALSSFLPPLLPPFSPPRKRKKIFES